MLIRQHLLCQAYHGIQQKKKSNMHSISPYYITGLVETDGSFVVTFDKHLRSRYRRSAVPKFYITQYLSEQSDINPLGAVI